MLKKILISLILLLFISLTLSPVVIGFWIRNNLDKWINEFNYSHPAVLLKKKSFALGFFSSIATVQLSLSKKLQSRVVSTPNTVSMPLTYQLNIKQGPVIFADNYQGINKFYFAPFVINYKIKQIGFNTQGTLAGSFGGGVLSQSKAQNIDIQFDGGVLHLKNISQQEHLSTSLVIKKAQGKIGEVGISLLDEQKKNNVVFKQKKLKYVALSFPEKSNIDISVDSFEFYNPEIKESIIIKKPLMSLSFAGNKHVPNRADFILNLNIKETHSNLAQHNIESGPVDMKFKINIDKQNIKELIKQVPLFSRLILLGYKNNEKAQEWLIIDKAIFNLINKGLNATINITSPAVDGGFLNIDGSLLLPPRRDTFLMFVLKIIGKLNLSLPASLIKKTGTKNLEEVVHKLIEDKLMILKNGQIEMAIVYKQGGFTINKNYYTFPQMLQIINKIFADKPTADKPLLFLAPIS